MGLPGLASPGTVKGMLEILFFLYRASRAETPLFEVDATARSFFSEAIGNLFFTVHKTRAHPAVAEPDRFFPVHDSTPPGCSLFLQLLNRISTLKCRLTVELFLMAATYCFYNSADH
jgi:hypothetical protein